MAGKSKLTTCATFGRCSPRAARSVHTCRPRVKGARAWVTGTHSEGPSARWQVVRTEAFRDLIQRDTRALVVQFLEEASDRGHTNGDNVRDRGETYGEKIRDRG